MKKTTQVVRGYDLNGRFGSYKENNNLKQWVRFSPEKRYPARGKMVKGLEAQGLESTTTLYNTTVAQNVPVYRSLSDETYLTPGAGNGSIVTNTETRLVTDLTSKVDLTDEKFSVSIWANFQNSNIAPETDAQIAMVSTADYHYQIVYDKDGGGGLGWRPSININVLDSGFSSVANGIYRLGEGVAPDKKWEGWGSLTITMESATPGQAAHDPGTDWTVSFNGVALSATSTSAGAGDTAASIATLTVGGPIIASPKPGRITAYGEVAIWNEKLSKASIDAVYERGTTAASSGFASLGPRAQVCAVACEKDAYPTISRSTDQRRLNRNTPYFNDTETIVFGESPNTPVNLATRLISASLDEAAIVGSPNTVPNLYAGGIAASTSFEVTNTTTANFENKLLYLRDAVGRQVAFSGSTDAPGSNSTRVAPQLYTIGFWDEGSGSIVSTTYEAAGRIVAAINNAWQNGDLSINARRDDSSYVFLNQLNSGFSGNSAVDGSLTTAGNLGSVSNFTGGSGWPGTGSVASNVVGNYRSRSIPSHASALQPFDDSRVAVDINTSNAYLPNFAPGFTDTMGDRIMIEIDITPNREHQLAVITGSGGRTYFLDNPNLRTNPETTGLAYFDFERNQWQNVGGSIPRRGQTGLHRQWNLPQERSSSKGSVSLSTAVRNGSKAYSTYVSNWLNFENGVNVAAKYTKYDLDNVPRLFQPFSSLLAHRTTFNFIYDWEYLQRSGPGTGNKYTHEIMSFDPQLPAIDNSTEWLSLYSLTNDPDRTAYPATTLRKYVFNSRFQCDQVNLMTSDWLGLSKPLIQGDPNSRYDFRKPKIWNINDNHTGSIFSDGLDRQLGAIGLPIAYTKYSTNPMFYASSSQLIRVGDYIDVPFLLEAVEIETDVDVKRCVYTTNVYGDGGRGTFDDQEISAWSTTTNAVDCLTFFVAKASEPGVEGPGKAESISELANQTRDLITWSNSVFYSPYIGWDFWQSWSHPYVSWQSSPTVGNPLHPWGAGPDEKWPRPENAGKERHFAFYPACGRRVTRRFQLSTQQMYNKVEACDLAQEYKNTDGSAIQVEGPYGIFHQAVHQTERLTGVPTGSAADPHGDRSKLVVQPAERWISASAHISKRFPVRVCGPYAQHDVPLIPADQFLKAGDGQPTKSRTNILPIAVDNWGTYNATGINTTPSNSGVGSSNARTSLAGWDWIGQMKTPNANIFAASGPREFLACYGRYWPGGTTTSDAISTPDVSWDLPPSLLILTASVDEAVAIKYPNLSRHAEPANPRLFRKDPSSKPTVTSIKSRPHAVFAQYRSTARLPVPPYTPFTGLETSQTEIGTLPHRPLGQGTTQSEPNFVQFPTSGSIVYESAQVLLPEDQLILGCQWSPADPVHASFENMRKVLKYSGQTTTAGGAVAGITADDNGQALTYWAYNYIDADPTRAPWTATTPRAFVRDRFMPNNGWTVGPGDFAAAPGGPYIPSRPQNDPPVIAEQRPMEFQYRFLGWDESNDIKNYASASCTIKKTPQKLRLYGVLLKEQKQYHHTSPQQTKTVCVHEAISNGPVIDQYDLATNSDFAGSLAAMAFSGTMLSPNPEGGPGLLTKDYAMLSYGYGVPTGSCMRQAWATSHGTTGMHTTSKSYSALYDMGSIKRVTKLSDLSEVYYDSMTPSIRGLWRKDGFQLLKYDEAGFESNVPFAAWAYTFVGDTAFNNKLRMKHTYWTINSGSTFQTNTSPNYKWPLAFPFEPRYHGVRRVLAEEPLKVAGVVDRNHSLRLEGQYAAAGTSADMAPWKNPCVDPGNSDTTGIVSGSRGSFWQGFSWETGWQGWPIKALGKPGDNLNVLYPAMMTTRDGYGTQWMAKRGGYPDAYSSGSGPRGIESTDPSGWSVSRTTPFVANYWWNLTSANAGPRASAKESWLGEGYINQSAPTGYWNGTANWPSQATTPRYGAATTIPGGFRNLGYVFYPHYQRVQDNNWSSLTMQRITGPEFLPPIQFSYHSGGFGEICIKNSIFGVGRLMFAPEPSWVFLSSSQDTVTNSPAQFWYDRFDTSRNGVTWSKTYSPWVGYGNASHFDFFCSKPRGWRYGLLNGFPLRPTCVYRRDRYGQLRDMLEQRQYTAFYVDDPADVASTRRQSGKRVRRKQYPRRRAYAIRSVFRTPVWENPNATNTQVPAAETQSSNLSLYATSSLPYFDEEVKNRDALPSTAEVIII